MTLNMRIGRGWWRMKRWQRDGREMADNAEMAEKAEMAKGWQKDGGDGREMVERWRRWSAAVSPGATFPSRGRKNRACGPGGNFPEVDRTHPQKKETAKVTIKPFIGGCMLEGIIILKTLFWGK